MTIIDWVVLSIFSFTSLGIGLFYTNASAGKGQEGFFTANRNLSWWSLGISNSATYQSGLGAFVMLIFMYGFAGNWLWWAQWIIWMPLVAIIWSGMWQRMKIVTTAELISIRYEGKMAEVSRKTYALVMCCFAMITIAYITGFFAKTVAPLMPMSIVEILILFGSVTVIYTLTGGLMGSVMVSVIQMIIMIAGSLAFLLYIIPQHGGWTNILDQAKSIRPSTLSLNPVSDITPPLTLIMFVILGLFFAGSPTAGEGMTAQRFMAAKNEQHALGGQLFSTFISLCLRIIPLMGMGIICITLFWTNDPQANLGPTPQGMTMLKEPAAAWGELIKASRLPVGFVGLLVATEVAAFMSTLSALLNWGSSFIVNDFYKQIRPNIDLKHEIRISRMVTLMIFLISSLISIFFVNDMVSWFIFINSVVVIFWLPLAYFRFFWPRFNAWGELAATVLGIPLSILFWFILDFQHRPIWQGTGILFLVALFTIILVTFLTPKESDSTLGNFYIRCRPVAGWRKFRANHTDLPAENVSLRTGILDCILGIAACLGMAIASNAVFVKNWVVTIVGFFCALLFGGLLIKRSITNLKSGTKCTEN